MLEHTQWQQGSSIYCCSKKYMSLLYCPPSTLSPHNRGNRLELTILQVVGTPCAVMHCPGRTQRTPPPWGSTWHAPCRSLSWRRLWVAAPGPYEASQEGCLCRACVWGKWWYKTAHETLTSCGQKNNNNQGNKCKDLDHMKEGRATMQFTVLFDVVIWVIVSAPRGHLKSVIGW